MVRSEQSIRGPGSSEQASSPVRAARNEPLFYAEIRDLQGVVVGHVPISLGEAGAFEPFDDPIERWA